MQALQAAANYVMGRPGHQVSEGRKQELSRIHQWTQEKEFSDVDRTVYFAFMDRIFTHEVAQGNLSPDQIDAAAPTFSFNLEQDTVTYTVPTNPSGVAQPGARETRTVDLRTVTDQPTIQAIDALYEQGRPAFNNLALRVRREDVVLRAAAKGDPQGAKALQRQDSGALAALPKTKEEVEKTVGQLHMQLSPNEKRKAITRQCYVDYLQNKFGKKVTEKTLRGQHQFLSHALPLVTAEKQRVQDHTQEQLRAQTEDRCTPLREQIARQKEAIRTRQERVATLKQSIVGIDRAQATPEQQQQITVAEEEIARKSAEIANHQRDVTANEAQLKPMEQEEEVLRKLHEQAQAERGECATLTHAIQQAGQLPAQFQGIDAVIAASVQGQNRIEEEIEWNERERTQRQGELDGYRTDLSAKVVEIETERQSQFTAGVPHPNVTALEAQKRVIEQNVATINQAIATLQADKEALIAKQAKVQSRIDVLTECRAALVTLDQDKVKKALERITASNKELGEALQQKREHHRTWLASCEERVTALTAEHAHADTTPERQLQIEGDRARLRETIQREQASLAQEEQGYSLGLNVRLALLGNSVEHLIPKVELFEGWFTALRIVAHDPRAQYDGLKKEVHFLQNLYKRLTGVDEYALAIGLTSSPSYRSPAKDTEALKRIAERVAKDIQAADQAKLNKEKSLGDKLKFWQKSKRSKPFDLIGENGKIMTEAQVRSKHLSQEDTAECLRQLRYLRDTVGLIYQDRESYAEYCSAAHCTQKQESVEDVLVREAVLFEHVKGRGQPYSAEQLKASSLFVIDPDHAPREALIAELHADLDTIARTANQAIATVSELECEVNVNGLAEAEQMGRNARKVKELRASKVDLTLAPVLSLRERASAGVAAVQAGVATAAVAAGMSAARAATVARTVLTVATGVAVSAGVAGGAWVLERAGVAPAGTGAIAGAVLGAGMSAGQVGQALSGNRSLIGAGLAACGVALVESYQLGAAAPVYQLMVTNVPLFIAGASAVNRLYQRCHARVVGPAVPELEIGDGRERGVEVQQQRGRRVREVALAVGSMAMFVALYYAFTQVTQATGAAAEETECDNSAMGMVVEYGSQAVAGSMQMVAASASQLAAWAWENRVKAGILGALVEGLTSPQTRLFSQGVEALGRTQRAQYVAARVPGAATAGRGLAAAVRGVESVAHRLFGVVKDVAAVASVGDLWTKGKGIWNAFSAATTASAAAAPMDDPFVGPVRPSTFPNASLAADVCSPNATASAMPRFEEIT